MSTIFKWKQAIITMSKHCLIPRTRITATVNVKIHHVYCRLSPYADRIWPYLTRFISAVLRPFFRAPYTANHCRKRSETRVYGTIKYGRNTADMKRVKYGEIRPFTVVQHWPGYVFSFTCELVDTNRPVRLKKLSYWNQRVRLSSNSLLGFVHIFL